ncbi:hypothetical protein BT96DRAFT_984042 [Gymnopus androsaceus JB14]|uniref:Uncharacterized protein n=1 Tax=Gymnopus androsaceus JB14 TaxID=1447944 RepID=A0A6A4IR00_9AGAR|nr:hypothetical protein BT96DRAFT_984042 [Gymnopus androsaceus JB14]
MLIRLIPSASHPTVLFKLVFENLPETIQTPTAWTSQVGVQSILDQVSFDLVEQKIKCVFFDGELEEWDIASVYNGRLDSVIVDVNESAAEMDKERKREEELRELQRLKEEEERLEAAKQEETASRTSARKNKPGHKKQRSLLMNLVSALIPLSLNSPRTPRSPRSLPSSSPASPRSTSPASSIRSYFSDKLPPHPTSAPSTLSRASTLPNLSARPSRPVSASSLSSPYLTTIRITAILAD